MPDAQLDGAEAQSSVPEVQLSEGAADLYGAGSSVGAVDEPHGVVLVVRSADGALVLLVLEVALGTGPAGVEDVDEVAERVADHPRPSRPPGRSCERCMR